MFYPAGFSWKWCLCLFVSTVESCVRLSMEGPHCKVLPLGGIHLWIPDIRNPCRLVRFKSFWRPCWNWSCSYWKCLLFFFTSLWRFGRHPVLIISVLFMLVFGLTVAFSVNVPMFSTLRFFEGFCLAGITLSLYVLSKCLSLNLKTCANANCPFCWACCNAW